MMIGRKAREIVLQRLQEVNAVTTVELEGLGVSRATISRMARDGEIERISHGIYGRPWDMSHTARLASVAKAFPDGVLCLHGAARHWGWLDDGRSLPCVAVRSHVSKREMEVRQVRWQDDRAYEIGVEPVEVAPGVSMRCTGKVRTVVDFIRPLNREDSDDAMECLRAFVADGGSPLEVLRMAGRMGLSRAAADLLTAVARTAGVSCMR